MCAGIESHIVYAHRTILALRFLQRDLTPRLSRASRILARASIVFQSRIYSTRIWYSIHSYVFMSINPEDLSKTLPRAIPDNKTFS
jgi:hypothetical protein